MNARPVDGSSVARRAVVRGHVQGVYFRDSCRAQALANGVTGSATNETDGSVCVVLEGTPSAVEDMLGWLRRGPSRADVRDVEVGEIDVTGRSGFDVG